MQHWHVEAWVHIRHSSMPHYKHVFIVEAEVAEAVGSVARFHLDDLGLAARGTIRWWLQPEYTPSHIYGGRVGWNGGA